MNEIEIYKVTINDINLLQAISRQTFSETFSELNNPSDMQSYLTEELSVEKLTSELNNPHSDFYFISNNHMVIGYLKLNFGTAQTEPYNHAIEIERIYILKEFHGKQIGQLLYDKAIEIGQQQNADFVWLGVWEKNLRAIAFYKKNGFEEFDKHFFRLGNDLQTDILMKLSLKD